jgi:L-lactate dehydrogenase complex protein LldG
VATKEEILERIRRNIGQKNYSMPDIGILGIQYPDIETQFVKSSIAAGGKVVELQIGDNVNDVIRQCYPDAKTIASNVPGITIATVNPDLVEEAQQLDGTDVTIVEGQVGVAENGCIWIPQATKEKAAYFICENLVIIIDKKNLVNNMHEAYRKIQFNDYGFGTFISGPSKTADIEQALVMGAQSAREVTVIISNL